ncbi:MAG: transporter [Desulfobacterales bacterium]|nr:transporter [Desulfobacterales bacterium]
MKQKLNLASTVLFLVAFLLAGECQAIEIYDNPSFPTGFYLLSYPMYYTADKLKDDKGNTSADDLDLDNIMNLFRLSYYNTSTFKNTWAWSIVVPVGRTEMSDDHDEGIGDFTLIGAYWLIDDSDNKTWVATYFHVDIPFGSYDSAKAANMGMNVWKFKPVLAFAKYFGKFATEGNLKYTFYTKNDDTDFRQGNELRLDTLLGYFIKPNLALSGHLNAIIGEDNESGGEKVPDSAMRKYQAGASLFWNPGGPGIPAITFEYLKDFECENTVSGNTFLVRLCWTLK